MGGHEQWGGHSERMWVAIGSGVAAASSARNTTEANPCRQILKQALTEAISPAEV